MLLLLWPLPGEAGALPGDRGVCHWADMMGDRYANGALVEARGDVKQDGWGFVRKLLDDQSSG